MGPMSAPPPPRVMRSAPMGPSSAPMPPPTAGISVTLSRFRRPTYETAPTDAKAGCLYPNNARALRDAVNVGMVAIDELETTELAPEVGDAPVVMTGGGGLDDRPASKGQIDKVGREMKRVGMTPEEGRAWLLGRFKKQSRLELTEAEIAIFMGHLEGLPAADAVA